jgi:quinol-cytochrome oxidoreductase complex cytochrome b subunit
LAILALAFVAIHLVVLHRQSPSKNGADLADSRENLLLVLTKDFFLGLLVFGLVFQDAVFGLIHPDNWASFSRLSTPAHIEPEIYFL